MVAPTKRNGFNAGTQGVQISAANSATSGDAFSAPLIAGTGNGIYDAAAAMEGAMGCKITGTNGDTFTLIMTFTGALTAGCQSTIDMNSGMWPTAGNLYAGGRLRTASTNVAQVVLTSAGLLRVQNGNGGATLHTFNGGAAMPAGEYVIDLACTNDAATGRITCTVRNRSDGSTFGSYDSGSVLNTGTGNITSANWGKPTTGDTLQAGGFYLDDCAVVSGGAHALIDLTPLVVMDAGPDQDLVEPGATVTLDASGSVGESGFAWTQTAGTTVTLSATNVAMPTFEAPLTINGETLTFQVANGGVTDTVDIEVLPASRRVKIGGVVKPVIKRYKMP